MKHTTKIFFISLIISLFCLISFCIAPVINNLLDIFSNWGKQNCELYSDMAEYSSTLNNYFSNLNQKSLCRRQNAVYGLEYTSLILNLTLGILLSQLTLIHYFDKGFAFEKITGLIGFIGGIISFIFMLIYICFSGYIFTQDVAYKDLSLIDPYLNAIIKLYPNGALKKNLGDGVFVTIYEKDKSDEAQYIKYKDLGDEQYNYDKKYYETYYYTINNKGGDCISTVTSSCNYEFAPPFEHNKNRYLYDRWCLCLVLSVFVMILDIPISLFSFFVFKNKDNKEINIV